MTKRHFLDFEQPVAELEAKIDELRYVQNESAVDISEEIDRLSKKSLLLTKDIYSGLTPWERHPDGDELLHTLEGEVEVTLLRDGGPTKTRVRAGSMFVVPRGLWHRQIARAAVMQWGATPGRTEHSTAKDPRAPEGP